MHENLELAEELVELDLLLNDDDVTATLDRFVRRIRSAVAGCDDAAISVPTDGAPEILARHQESATDTAGPSHEALTAQLNAPTGPLHEALTYGEPRRVGDLLRDHRWPAFSAAAINAGYRSCLFLPLPDSANLPASFSLFSVKPRAFDSTSYDVVLLFALDAGGAVDNGMRLIERLQTALGNRAATRRAQHILMQCYDLTHEAASSALEHFSRNAKVKLSRVALDLVDAETTGELPQTLNEHQLTD